MNVLKSLRRVFTKEKVADKCFGELVVSQDTDSKSLYLEKDIEFGSNKNVTLTIESKNKEASKSQFDLYKMIRENYSNVWENSKDSYQKEYQTNLFDEYEVESICISDIDENFEWELWLVKKGRFENCVIEFEKLQVKRISFSA